MYDYLIEFFSQGASAYAGIILLLILTGAGLPVPEELPVFVAGVLSRHGTLQWGLAYASCLIGALCGDCVMYGIGRYFGRLMCSWEGRKMVDKTLPDRRF